MLQCPKAARPLASKNSVMSSISTPQCFASGRWIAAACFAVASLLSSPLGIKFATGRDDLPFRIYWLGVCFSLLLLVLAIAIIATGRWRLLLFYVFTLMLPVIFLATMEAAAIALHLSDRISLIEDNSVYINKGRWPAHLMSNSRMFDDQGIRLYRPWHGDGITINSLGLRTHSPQPKQPGEWRIALTGGSTAWGWRIADEYTIAAQLERAVHNRGYTNVKVYNFGIEGATLKSELALLQRFREVYSIDQVIFYTGGNDVISAYLDHQPSLRQATGFRSFELFKAATRLMARLNSTSSRRPKNWSQIRNSQTLKTGIITAAGYCQKQNLVCDFALQPWLFTHAHLAGTEAAMMRTFGSIYPGLDELWGTMYASALAAGPAQRTHDLRKALDTVQTQLFSGLLHINERGNSVIADRLLPIATRRVRSLPTR
jgi:hypothetical protein